MATDEDQAPPSWDADLEETAAEVVQAFEGMRQEDIWDRSGSDRYGGYTDPVDAAFEICDEAFEPFREHLEDVLAAGRMEAALIEVEGLLLGLSRLMEILPAEAEDFPFEDGPDQVLEAWTGKAPEEMDADLFAWMQSGLPARWAMRLASRCRTLRQRLAR